MARQYPLTDQQRLFAREYASLSNATQAAIKAGYSLKNAAKQGHKLKSDPRIMAIVAQVIANTEAQALVREAREIVDDARLLQELECSAILNPADAFDNDGKLLPIKEMPEPVQRAISSVKVRSIELGKATLTEIKFIDKLAAIKMMGIELGMFKDQHVYEHKLADMTDAELRAEAQRLAQVHATQAEKAELHGVELQERHH